MLSLFLFVAPAANADVEIHKCVDADGGVVYQQTPCPIVKKEPKEEPNEVPEIAGLPDQPEEAVEEEIEQEVIAEEDVKACKDPLRDAIDAIEAEMLRGFLPEQAEEFKAKLRTLTQKMRACG